MDNSSYTRSKHFVINPLSVGVFAAIARDGGSAISNAGLIDLGDQLLVFDTFLTPQAALDLKHFAAEQFGRAPRLVVNSHYHNDHIWGNQIFLPEAQILSSTRTRELIATAGMDEFNQYSTTSAQMLDTLRAQQQKVKDEHQQDQINLQIGYYEGLVEALPSLSVVMPGITFDSRLKIHGAQATAELITFEGAHTGSDTVLYLPQAGIVFMSDLLFVGCHPYLADGDPFRLLEALKELSRLEAGWFVPGHGLVGKGDDLKLLMDYVNQCLQTAQSLVDQGITDKEAISNLQVAEPFRNWQLPQFYRANIAFLCERLRSSQKS